MLRVAIIGAGLAGFSCAHELERHGISPVIYERNGFIGEPYPHCMAVLEISHRPIPDSIRYFRKDLNLDIRPCNTVNTIIHHAPKKTTTIRGNLGYLFKYTKDPDSIKCQIYSTLKNTRVILNKIGNAKALSAEYDYVVEASGTYAAANELGCWQEWLKAYIRGAVVLGDFDPNTVEFWLNRNYCKSGYAYLTPYNRKKANIILIVTDVDEREVDNYWELFLYSENIKYKIVEEFKLEHRSGLVYPLKLGNIYFAGNAGGGIEPYLGFGQSNALTMGVAAARSVALGKDYEKQVKSVIKRNLQMLKLREVFNTLTNRDYDKIVTAIGLPGIRHFLYYTPFNIAAIWEFVTKIIPHQRYDIE